MTSMLSLPSSYGSLGRYMLAPHRTMSFFAVRPSYKLINRIVCLDKRIVNWGECVAADQKNYVVVFEDELIDLCINNATIRAKKGPWCGSRFEDSS
jgi:hypothetical protein